VLGVGRLDALKRFDLLVRAVARSRGDWRVRLVGEGPEAEALRALAERSGVGQRVDFLGAVGDERLAALYAESAAVYYAPYDEDYGYVTVEALAAGRPVVTAIDSGGTLEFVEDGVNGFVVAPEPDAIAARLDALVADPAAASAMGERGRARVAAIGWDGVIEGLLR
jgi:glycosyltransferase involved in cell wall biosynthesis